MENPFIREPLQVTLLDVPTGQPVRSYVLLGSVPKAVLEAARRGQPRTTPGRVTAQTSWSAKDSGILEQHYGKRWKAFLTPTMEGLDGPAVTGGEEEFDFGDLEDFDKPDVMLAEGALDDWPQALTALEPEGGPALPPARPDWDPRVAYSDVAVYPEDTLEALKQKLEVVMGIPVYRQHIFFYTEEERGAPQTSYRLTLEGGIVVVDIRELSREMREVGKNSVAGLPIDSLLEERKEYVRVEALDAFRLLGEGPGILVRRVFVADLESLFRGRLSSLQKALSDRYQFDLLYYGLVQKYWPILTPEALRLAITNPDDIVEVFPLISPPAEKIRKRLAAERDIIDKVYAQSKAQKQRLSREQGRGGVAVTETTVTVEPRSPKTPINIRNVFDWVPVSHAVPAAIARVRTDAIEGGETGAYSRRNFILTKTHITVSHPRVASGLGRFLDRPPQRLGITYAINRSTDSSSPSYIYLTVYETGEYTILGTWREDDRVAFKEVIRQLTAASSPLIQEINSMGAAAFPLGGSLETPLQASRGVSGRTALGSMTVSMYWPHALTADGFKDMKTRWREYEKAGIVGIKGLQQAGAYTFQFRKGIVNYAPRAIERVVYQRGDDKTVVTNQYAYMADPGLAQRWARVYGGRLVRVYHRVTDLRIELVGVDMEEFARIQLYMFTFLDALMYGPQRLGNGIVTPGERRTPEGRLKSLQERDPNLYDLKKYDENATVYSVLCQGDRQPELISEDEYRAMGAKKRAHLVEYWNFTEGRPAYYRCGSQRFPHLSFRVGEHPLGYCIPCCKKTLPAPGSKVLAYSRACAEHRQLSAEEIAALDEESFGSSRHVLSYGKPVPPGRISDVPQLLSEGLFYDTIRPPYVYRLVGVAQDNPALPGAGVYYAIAAMLERDPGGLARELADAVLAIGPTYRGLANGAGSVFAADADLADAFLVTFLHGGVVSPFGPGGAAEKVWKAILIDLVHIVFNLMVVEFVDDTGDGSPIFEASSTVATKIQSAEPATIGIVVTSPAGSYPFAAVNQKDFLRRIRSGETPRWTFGENDRAVPRLRDMLTKESAKAEVVNTRFTMDFVAGACERGGYRVSHRLINLRDACYGLLITLKTGELVYFPVAYSAHYTPPLGRSVSALYGARPDGKYPAEALAAVFEAVNAAAAKIRPKQALNPIARLVNPKRQTIGFIAEVRVGKTDSFALTGAAMYFHHDPVAGGLSGLPWGDVPEAAVPYNMRDIDADIYSSGGVPSSTALPEDKQTLAARGMYKHRLYRLFLAEFAAILQSERNELMRSEIKDLIKQTKFSAPASVASFRATLRRLLSRYMDDYDTVRDLVAKTYAKVGAVSLNKSLAEAFDLMTFDFDRTTLTKLRELGDPIKISAALTTIMRPHIDIASANTEIGIANMYIACSLPGLADRPQCKKGKLSVPEDRFSEYVKILAADILNPLKTVALSTLVAGVVNGSRFVVRPGERITIS